MSSAKPVLAGVSILLWREDERGSPQYLVGLRAGSHGAGTWALPGGSMDFGEDVVATAARELEEETGLSAPTYDIACLDVVTNDIFPEAGKHFITMYAAARAPQGWTPQVCEPEKCEGWRWVSEREMRGLSPKFRPLACLLEGTRELDELTCVWIPKRTLNAEEAEAARRGAVFTENRYTGSQQADFRACDSIGTRIGRQLAGPGGRNVASF